MNQHLARYKAVYRSYLSSINVNLFKIANVSKQSKEDIPLFIDQKVRVNFADLLIKFSLKIDSPSKWLKLQTDYLTHPGF